MYPVSALLYVLVVAPDITSRILYVCALCYVFVVAPDLPHLFIFVAGVKL